MIQPRHSFWLISTWGLGDWFGESHLQLGFSSLHLSLTEINVTPLDFSISERCCTCFGDPGVHFSRLDDSDDSGTWTRVSVALGG